MVVLVLAFFGFITWLITTEIPMPPVFVKVIIAFVVFALVFWLITEFRGQIPALR
jgi:hypothetical protein